MEILQIKNVSKKYDNKKALDNVSFNIESGNVYGLLGKNGAGKTTLIKMINTLLTIDEGQILFMGKELGKDSKENIAYLPERTYLDKQMKVSEVLDFFECSYSNFDKNLAMKYLNELGIEKNLKISTMSKGMQEKLQLILVISRKAKLYILDEPLGGVDPATRKYIIDKILTNISEDSSILISTHLISDIEKILDKVIFIDNGKINEIEESDVLRERENMSIDEIFKERFKC